MPTISGQPAIFLVCRSFRTSWRKASRCSAIPARNSKSADCDGGSKIGLKRWPSFRKVHQVYKRMNDVRRKDYLRFWLQLDPLI